jgi:hypothetical protein
MPYWLDGNNLIGQSASVARKDPGTRKSFLALLGGYARSRGGRFLVYFDGDDPDRSLPPPGVRVRYSAPYSTDDALLRDAAAAKAPGEIIIVTNDRSLSARCHSAGTRTMDWRQFVEKVSTRSRTAPPAKGAREEKIDLEEWSRYLGLDPASLDEE